MCGVLCEVRVRCGTEQCGKMLVRCSAVRYGKSRCGRTLLHCATELFKASENAHEQCYWLVSVIIWLFYRKVKYHFISKVAF